MRMILGHPSPEAAARIAVVGVACRLPGASDTEAFRQLLWAGRETITDIPSSRRHLAQGVERAGLLDEIEGFDPEFFGIAQREADQMDPQQRLLLELAVEALDAAGIPRADLAGSRTGVYVGISSSDYSRLQAHQDSPLDLYAGTGNALSIAANRLSYVLDLAGPSLALDTACSSSLNAVHLAVRALRSGEIDLALVGGVNLLLAGDLMQIFANARMLSPEGRCKTFDADADGYVRGEGGAVFILKRATEATADNDHILALIAGSAANQDGRSNGLTAPSGPAQVAVIEAALADAGLRAADIDAVELHGTGTPLGDPIEAQALGQALHAKRARPLAVGSVKTNIGHLESAAGAAGLLKAVLALQQGELPATLNFRRANPEIDLEALGLHVAVTPVPLSTQGRPARIGVSSFGFGGSNAHVILEAAAPLPERPEPETADPTQAWSLPLSAAHPEALRELAARYAERLASATPRDLREACYSAARRRDHLDHRLFVHGDRATLVAALRAAAEGRLHGALWQGQRPAAGPRKLAILAAEESLNDGRFAVGRVLAAGSGKHVARKLIGRWDLLLQGATAPAGLPERIRVLHASGGVPHALALLYVHGHDPNWAAVYPQGRLVALPAYPWRRRRCWFAAAPERSAIRLEQPPFHQVGGARLLPMSLAYDLARDMLATPALTLSIEQAVPVGDAAISLHVLAEGDAIVLAAGDDRERAMPWVRADAAPLPSPGERDERAIRFEPPLQLADSEDWLTRLLQSAAGEDARAMPDRLEGVWSDPAAGVAAWGLVRIAPEADADGAWWGEAAAWTEAGVACAGVARLRLRPLSATGKQAPENRHAYRIHWRELPGLDAQGMPALPPLASDEQSRLQLLQSEQLCAAYTRQAFRELGWVGDSLADPAALGERLGIIPEQRRLFARLCQRLAGADGDARPASDRLAELRAGLAPDMAAGLDLIERAGNALGEVLSGRKAPLEVLFPGGNLDSLTAIYTDSRPARAANARIRDAVAALGQRPGKLRVLEIGAGTGGSTGAVIDALPRGRWEYHFTDLSDHFFAAARARWGAHSGFRCAKLDIEVGQAAGDAGSYDLIVAANVLHATRDLRTTLANAAHLLAPGGCLLMLEITRPRWDLDLSFGLTEGWWRFEDSPLRQDGPLLDPDAWLRLLDATGLEAARAYPADPEHGQSLLLARKPMPATGAQRWLLVNAGGSAEPLKARIEADGDIAVAVNAKGGLAERKAAIAEALAVAGPSWRAVLHLEALDVQAGDGTQALFVGGLSVVQALSESGLTSARLWLATRAAQTVAADDALEHPRQAVLHGIARTLANEAPHLLGASIDLPAAADGAQAAGILHEAVRRPRAETELVWRGGRWLAARLQRTTAAAMPPSALDADGVYLVTGAFGALADRLLPWLVERGARRLALLGRRAPGPAAQQRIEELRQRGARIETLLCDAADADALRAAVTEAERRLEGPLAGVVHTAGSYDGASLALMSEQQAASVLGAKADGALTLADALRERELTLFLLVSSAAATFGMPGNGNYNAANAVLDALAAQRRGEGRHALSISPAPIAGIGMETTASKALRAHWEQLSLQPLPIETLLRQIEQAQDTPHQLVLPVDWKALSQRLAEAPPPLLSELLEPVAAERAAQAAPAAEQTAWRQLLADVPASQRGGLLEQRIGDLLARILHLPAGQRPDPALGLQAQGLDSLMALEFHDHLQRASGLSLPSTLALETPSVRGLATRLLPLLRPAAEAAAEAPPAITTVGHRLSERSGKPLQELLAAVAELNDAEAWQELIAATGEA